MQAMARAQAQGQGPDDSFPFSTLRVWREKLQADLGAPGGGQDWALRLLVEQSKDVEQAVLGCLKDALFDLHEGVTWGLLSPEFGEAQRHALVNAAANELHSDKQLCVQLAREHGVLEEYAASVKKAAGRTLSDYERVGELKFGLLVWRANLRRDASLAADAQEVRAQMEEAYLQALRLIRRCGTQSLSYWSAQRAGGAPTRDSKQHLYQTAVQRVQNSLLELAQARGLDAVPFKSLFQQLSDPESEAVGEDPEPEGSDGGEPPADITGREGLPPRSSSEESETAALGF